MKTIALAVLFTIFVVVAEGARCRSSADCEPEECCLGKSIFGIRKGDCAPRAQINETCSEEDDMAFNNKYLYHCPCASGLTCEPEETKSLGIFGQIKINERCVGQPGTTVSEPEPETQEPEEGTPEPEEENTPEPEEDTPEPEEEADE